MAVAISLMALLLTWQLLLGRDSRSLRTWAVPLVWSLLILRLLTYLRRESINWWDPAILAVTAGTIGLVAILVAQGALSRLAGRRVIVLAAGPIIIGGMIACRRDLPFLSLLAYDPDSWRERFLLLSIMYLFVANNWLQQKQQSPISLGSLIGLFLFFIALFSLMTTGIRVAKFHAFGTLPTHPLDDLGRLPTQAYWISPVALIPLYLVPLTALLIVPILGGPRPDWRTAIAAFLPIAMVDFLFNATMMAIHPIALIVLSFGLTTILMRRIDRNSDAARDRVRRWTIPLSAAALIVAIGVPTYLTMSETRPSASRQVPPADSPNVILITMDTVRAQNLSVLGYPRETTPELSKLANEGVVFERGIVPCSWTLPTHASLMTGELPNVHRAGYFTPMDQSLPTLAGVLRSAGYRTAGFIANEGYCGSHTGLARGFDHYDDAMDLSWHYLFSKSLVELFINVVHTFPPPDFRRPAETINDHFWHWIDQNTPAPFFAFINYFDAHFPYTVPDPAYDQYSPLPADQKDDYHQKWIGVFEAWETKDPTELQYAIDTYDSCIRYIDAHIGQLVRNLKQRGLDQNTILIITTDHGEHFSENTLFGHGNSLYRTLIDAPLILHGPGLGSTAIRTPLPVDLRNLPATIVDLARPGMEHPLPGKSLRSCWSSSADPGAFGPIRSELTDVPAEDGKLLTLQSIVDHGHHYIREMETGREELYDFDADPLDQNDLARRASHQSILNAMRGQLSPAPAHAVTTTANEWRRTIAGADFCRCGPCQRPSRWSRYPNASTSPDINSLLTWNAPR